jgi:hypothetical protein
MITDHQQLIDRRRILQAAGAAALGASAPAALLAQGKATC